MSRRTLEFFISKKMSSLPQKREATQEFIFVKNIAKPSSAGRNEDASRQKRNSILSFYVDQRKCQAYALEKQDEEREENN